MSRISFTFSRSRPLAYLSHLDLMRLLIRALRRSELPLAYSEGFNPHPRLNLALPLPLGVTASNEPGEVSFSENVTPKRFLQSMGKQLPDGLQLIDAKELDQGVSSLAAIVSAALYRAELKLAAGCDSEPEKLQDTLKKLLGKEEILAPRAAKKKSKVVKYINVRPFIIEAELEIITGGPAVLKLLLKAGSQGGISPVFLLEQLALEVNCDAYRAHCWNLHREYLYKTNGGVLQPLSEGM
jgi:radical SAM-linked protein